MDNSLVLGNLEGERTVNVVLILVVMDNSLVPKRNGSREVEQQDVLILVVMDNSLVLIILLL